MTEAVPWFLWALILLLALLLLVMGVRRLRARRLRLGEALETPPALQPPAPAPDGAWATRYPIVLAHGWMGFDVVALPGVKFRHEYFRGVRACLEADGQRVYTLRVSPFAGISHRAAQLRAQLEALGLEKVNIIAHSMGGLDARYAISRLGLSQRVASLITIGTPHFGTPLADGSVLMGNVGLLHRMVAGLGGNYRGLFDIGTRRMQRFNERVPDADGVFYGSYVAVVDKSVGRVHQLLRPGYAYLNWRVGPNDGLIPASSQRWGEHLGDVCADHWAQIGWSGGFDACGFYRALARLLARRGL